MTALQNKIDFALVFTARNANPNGDPLDGNRPRTTYEGIGEVSDVCIKRKVRNRWVDEGYPVFVQSDDHRAVGDNFRSLKDRADACPALKACLEAIKTQKKTKDAAPVSREDYAKIAGWTCGPLVRCLRLRRKKATTKPPMRMPAAMLYPLVFAAR